MTGILSHGAPTLSATGPDCGRAGQEEPPTVVLDEAALLPFTCRYVSDMWIIDISPSGDGGLTAKPSFPPGSPRIVQSDQ